MERKETGEVKKEMEERKKQERWTRYEDKGMRKSRRWILDLVYALVTSANAEIVRSVRSVCHAVILSVSRITAKVISRCR